MNSTVGLLILFSIGATWLFARAGVASGALIFSLLALVLFVNTPVGAPLPGKVAEFLQSVNDNTTPHLTKDDSDGEHKPKPTQRQKIQTKKQQQKVQVRER